jgi:hypothetical protein
VREEEEREKVEDKEQTVGARMRRGREGGETHI